YVQFGISIPVYTFGQTAKINAAKTNEVIATNNYELKLQNFKNVYRSTYTMYSKYQEAKKYFETTGLKNAESINKISGQQFLNGEINYLDWVILNNQAAAIYADYIEAVKNRNNAIAELDFYINK